MQILQDIVFSLILVPIRSGLRGFCLFILEIFSMEYQQKNPLKYYILPFIVVYRFMVSLIIKIKKRLTFGHWNLIIDDYLVIVIWLLVFGIY